MAHELCGRDALDPRGSLSPGLVLGRHWGRCEREGIPEEF